MIAVTGIYSVYIIGLMDMTTTAFIEGTVSFNSSFSFIILLVFQKRSNAILQNPNKYSSCNHFEISKFNKIVHPKYL